MDDESDRKDPETATLSRDERRARRRRELAEELADIRRERAERKDRRRLKKMIGAGVLPAGPEAGAEEEALVEEPTEMASAEASTREAGAPAEPATEAASLSDEDLDRLLEPDGGTALETPAQDNPAPTPAPALDEVPVESEKQRKKREQREVKERARQERQAAKEALRSPPAPPGEAELGADASVPSEDPQEEEALELLDAPPEPESDESSPGASDAWPKTEGSQPDAAGPVAPSEDSPKRGFFSRFLKRGKEPPPAD